MDEKKYFEYKYSDKVVEISDVLPMDGVEVRNPFVDILVDAMKTATKESIKANSVILNEKFAKVNPHLVNIFGTTAQLPAMICGLECSMISDELPDEYAFAILEKPQTEREYLIEKTKSETAIEIFEEIFEVLCCFTMQGKSKEHNEGYIDCLEEVDKRLQNLAKEKYGLDLGE